MLDEGHLSGATLDVFATEPLPGDSPIWSHPKIMVTPHMAAITDPRSTAITMVESMARIRAECASSAISLPRVTGISMSSGEKRSR